MYLQQLQQIRDTMKMRERITSHNEVEKIIGDLREVLKPCRGCGKQATLQPGVCASCLVFAGELKKRIIADREMQKKQSELASQFSSIGKAAMNVTEQMITELRKNL